MSKINYLVIILVFTKLISFGQSTHSIQGYVLDSVNQEPLIGAYIVNNSSKQGTTTNESGFFKLQTRQNHIKLKISYVGYKPYIVKLEKIQDTIIKILLPNNSKLNEIVVTATRKKINSVYSGVEYMSAKTVNNLPVVLGEPDLFKSLSLLPGISFGNENTMGFFVRGGSNTQNLILLNEMPIYNANHLYGLFSTFNTQAINGMTLYKGSIPAQYGGKLSSVLDVRTKLGSATQIKGSLSTGFILSQLTFQLPLFNGNTRIMLSARRSMFDIYSEIIATEMQRYLQPEQTINSIDLNNYHMGDVVFSISQKINKRNNIKFTLFTSADEENFPLYKHSDIDDDNGIVNSSTTDSFINKLNSRERK